MGGIHNIHVDVRIICATNRNLENAIQQQGFRDDLFYRLNEITLFLPTLRERPEDIPLLVNHFVDKYNMAYGREFARISPNVIGHLIAFTWPGNIRQLENMIKQAVVRGDDTIMIDLISSASAHVVSPQTSVAQYATVPVMTTPDTADGYSLKARIGKTVAEEETKLISQVLTKTNWNRRKASDLLEISYRSLLYKIKDYRLDAPK